MPGKWMSLAEVLGVVGPSKEAEILTCLRRGDLSAWAEKHTLHWIHRKDPIFRREGDNGYRMVTRAPTRMVPIQPDWWDICEVDFADSTAHVRWNSAEMGQIGSSQPFKALVEGVILRADDIERLWPPSSRPVLATASSGSRKRGPEPVKLLQTMESMRRFGLSKVRRMKEEAMASQFKASRDTCRKALQRIEEELRQSPTSDK